MEKLLKIAREVSDQVEIFSHKSSQTRTSFEDSSLRNIDTTYQCGIALRLIRDGKLGFAYTRNLADPSALVEAALSSLKAGVEAPPEFIASGRQDDFANFDGDLSDVDAERLCQEGDKLIRQLKSVGGQINLKGRSRIDVIGLATACFLLCFLTRSM
jgi:PmbA protein